MEPGKRIVRTSKLEEMDSEGMGEFKIFTFQCVMITHTACVLQLCRHQGSQPNSNPIRLCMQSLQCSATMHHKPYTTMHIAGHCNFTTKDDLSSRSH